MHLRPTAVVDNDDNDDDVVNSRRPAGEVEEGENTSHASHAT